MGFAVLSLLLQVFLSYARYSKYLKGMALVLLAYIITAFTISNIDWREVLHNTIIPNMHLSKIQILLVCAILGTTISPYLFFWQTSQEVEEEILKGATSVSQRKSDVDHKGIRKMRIDVWLGMLFSNFVMFFIILTCGALLHTEGVTDIQSAAQAAEALRPLAGQATFLLFAIGIVGLGLLAVPVLAGSAAYALAESFRWKEGLYRKLKNAYAFYGILGVAMLVGFILNFIGLDPVRALIYAAIGNGIVAPIILYFIVSLSGRKSIMGEFANSRIVASVGWVTIIAMTIVAVALIVVLFV
jgi:Mn2+/Fe2+ NRAMP family transporter